MPLPPKAIPTALSLLEDAKKAYKAKFTPGFYHATGASDIKEFIPSYRGATFVTRDPEFAESFHPIDEAASEALSSGFAYKKGATTYPLSINMGKHFDVDTPEGRKFVEEFLKKQPDYFPHKLENFLGDQSWSAVENRSFMKALKNAGFDTFSIREGGVKNVGVFNPKNIRGKFAEFNPEHAESADFMKAEGGQINPIKTPREMLFEMVQLPRMASGRLPPPVQEMVASAIKKFVQKYKRMPPPEDIKALEAHAHSLTQRPTIWSDPVTQARARHQLATDPNLMNPEGPDPFLTKAMTGRTVKGTYLEPKPMDINDPNVVKAIEAEQSAGTLDVPPTTTPGSSALAETATALENRELSQGATPLIDKLKAKFFKEHNRFPTEEEMDALIAGYNPLRHQYGPAGASIVQSRPPTAKGMQQWKERARAEGIPESYLEKSPVDYRKNLQDELSIGQGVQPTTPLTADDAIKNPNREYADGRGVAALTPAEMQAMMVAHGRTPSKLMPKETGIEKGMRYVGSPIFGLMAAQAAKQRLEAGDPYEASLYGASALGSGMAMSRKLMKPGLGIAGFAAAPLSIDEAFKRYEKGDRTGAVLAAIEAAGNAAAMYPPTAIPGTLIGMGAGMANAFRGEPEYKSVMEDHR